jgi:uncharacterized membrane protein
MKLRLFIICIAAVLALAVPTLANSTATVHGEVYLSDTFEPLENATVTVNSTPVQYMVAKYGLYSFELGPGDYTITAKYYQNNTLTYSAEETVKIKDGGKYVVDLLLFPVYSEELMDGSGVKEYSKNSSETVKNSSLNTANPLTGASTGQMNRSEKNNSGSVDLTGQSGAELLNTNYLIIALLLLVLLIAGYRFYRKDKKIEENQPQKKGHITGKEHTIGGFSESLNVPEIPVEVHDERVVVSHENIEPEREQESQVQGSWVEPSETISAIEPVAEPVKESVRESLKEPVKELVKEPVNEQIIVQVKESASEVPEEKMQTETAEIKEDSPANGRELIESEPHKEKQEIAFEEADKSIESPKIEIPVSRKKFPLPTDLQEVMDIIRGQGGRITQKDLRSKLRYSEGKVSLMLADLERRELIEKFKRGRGNVVILKEEER